MQAINPRTIAVALAAVLAGTVLVQAAAANAPQDAREPAASMALVVFEDVPGSDALLRGDYETGLRQSLEASEHWWDRHAFELANNVCVAQLKLGRMEAAQESCGQVVEHRPNGRPTGTLARRFEAVALVNHGVLLSARGDVERAGTQFERASRQFPELGVARSNLQFVGGAAPRVEVGDEP